jgi:hypothetical protein
MYLNSDVTQPEKGKEIFSGLQPLYVNKIAWSDWHKICGMIQLAGCKFSSP